MGDLTCITCGAGPYGDRRALAAHLKAHAEPIPCPECGQMFKGKSGLGKHRNSAHGILGPSSTTANRDAKTAETRLRWSLRDAIAKVLPDVAPEISARLLELCVEHRPARDGYIVVGAAFGPVMTTRVMVGNVVRNAAEPCLVVDAGRIAEAQAAQERVG